MDNLIEIIKIKGIGYGLLSNIFLKEPNEELLTMIKKSINVGDDELYFPFIEASTSIENNIKKLDGFLKGNDLSKLSKDLLIEYNKLFLIPGKSMVDPWESPYFNDERLLFQEQTTEVRNTYFKYNYVLNTKINEPEDHIGFQLAFLEILSKIQIDFLGKNRVKFIETIKDESEFLKQHLGKWIGIFNRRIKNAKISPFYKIFASVVEEYIKINIELNGEILEEQLHG